MEDSSAQNQHLRSYLLLSFFPEITVFLFYLFYFLFLFFFAQVLSPPDPPFSTPEKGVFQTLFFAHFRGRFWTLFFAHFSVCIKLLLLNYINITSFYYILYFYIKHYFHVYHVSLFQCIFITFNACTLLVCISILLCFLAVTMSATIPQHVTTFIIFIPLCTIAYRIPVQRPSY